MFYTYALPFDTAGSTVYSKAVSAATVQVSFAFPRTAPDLVVVGAQTSQSAGYPPPAFTGPFSRDFSTIYPGGGARLGPFSRAFSSTYGEATGVGNHTPLTVNKLADFGASMTVFLEKKAPVNKPLPTSQSQVASYSYLYLAIWLAATTSIMSALLTFPRIYHNVSATLSANTAWLRRSYAFWLRVNTPSNLFTDEFTNEWGVGRGGHIESLSLSINQVLTRSITAPWVGAQTTAMVKRVSRLSRVLSASVALILRQPSQFARAISNAVQARVLGVSRGVAVSSGSAFAIIRRASMRSNATTTQSPSLSFGGHFVRVVGTVTSQGLGLLRQLATLYGAVTDGRSALIRSTLKSLAVANGSGALVVKTVSLVRPAVTLGLTLVTRSIGIPRQVVSGSLVAVSRIAAHVSPLIQAVTTSVADLTKVLAHGVDLALPTAQAMASSLARVSARLRSFNATQALSSDVLRGIGRSLSAASVAVASATKAITLFASVASQFIVSVITSAAHFVSASVLTGVSLGDLRVARPVLNAAEPLVSSVSTGFGRFAHISPGTFSTSAATIVRLTGKLVATVTDLLVEQIRGVVAITLHSELVQVVSYSQAARSVVLVVAQSQRSRTVRWFHLFVPEWAYQQTALLPPGGGHAEPPAFGPIDPADQTTFAFDWSVRGDVNDPIASATISATPPGMTFFGPVFISGSLVEVTVLPFTPPRLPMTYRLRCTAVFASGRRSSFTIPVPVRTL